ncbi:MAG: lipopolysaccharide biosynthesis protein [Prevotella sp.]|nr:lipopolysaccharide biosynthesis protein [Prevotella sp.]
MSETLKEKTAKGMFWGGMNNGIQQLIGFIYGIILARLLDQSDFGVMAMISVFPLIANALKESGFTSALTNLKQPTHQDYNAVFWFNIIVGWSSYIVLFFCAPLIARYYHNPELVPLCRYSFLSIVFSSLATAQSAHLFKELKAKQMAQSGMASIIASSVVGGIMAYMGYGYWSLATQGLVFVGTDSLLKWHFSDWRPTFEFDFSPVRRMFRFSFKILATNIINQINNNILNILLGRHYSKTETGVYNQAYNWDFKCFSLVQGMVNQVAQPVLADLNGENQRQLNAFRKMMRFTAFLSFPMLLGFGLVAQEFIIIAITAKWLASARLLQLLCISGAVLPLCTLMSNMIISKGKSGINFWVTSSLGISQIILMTLIWPWGIRDMVIGYVILNLIWLLIWHFFVNRLICYPLMLFLKDILPFALAAGGVMATTYFLTLPITNLVLLLICRIILAAVLYFIVMKVARVKILDECLTFLKSKIKKQ